MEYFRRGMSPCLAGLKRQVYLASLVLFITLNYSASSFPSNDKLSNAQTAITTPTTTTQAPASNKTGNNNEPNEANHGSCSNGLLTFELSTGFIYKPSAIETLAMMPSTLQLTDCLDYCLGNASCLAINFEMGLCVLLSSSAKQNPHNLYSSQFPVFTIYAEKKCLLSAAAAEGQQATLERRARKCERAWSFERVAGYEMKTTPRKRLKLNSREHCMEACLVEREFECRSANWYRQAKECTLSDQDRHSVSQSEAGDQQIKASLLDLYGPTNLTAPASLRLPPNRAHLQAATSLYQNYYSSGESLLLEKNATTLLEDNEILAQSKSKRLLEAQKLIPKGSRKFGQLSSNELPQQSNFSRDQEFGFQDEFNYPVPVQYVDIPANAPVDYLENNCIYEPNKLCEFRKIQNRVLKTVDSIYQDVNSLEECKQKCLNAPYRCYSFDYGDTSERVCRTSHLDQASLLSVKEPYLDVVGAITYELASCFNVTIQCKAREMVASVSSSKSFKGKIYVKTRPNTCVNDVRESLRFELTMKYHDANCDVQASSSSQQGVFSNDIIIQHHDRIVTTQDVGLTVYCQYDLGNRSITNNVELAIERIDAEPLMESKTQPANFSSEPANNSPLMITSLATTVVRSPNVTMRITNINGQPVSSATVGDRLALLFEIKEKTSPFGIFVREIIAMDGKQLMTQANKNNNASSKLSAGNYHYSATNLTQLLSETNVEFMFQANKANSIQFIDSDGCPTDANIMGPLVKMDAGGQRILAPFDAFKFPTSDMVFFRAVVSSCVSECKPVLCNSNNPTPLLQTDTSLLDTTTTTPSRKTEKPARSEARSTTPLPTAPEVTSLYQTSQQYSMTSPSFGSSSTSQQATSRWPEEAQESAGRATTTGGDLLTTVAGFNTPTRSWPTTAATVFEQEQPQDLQVNMTNNHQGKAPPRPPIEALSQSQAAKQQAPMNLDLMSAEEKQQLVKLFETKLKQQLAPSSATNNNGSISEVADLYTGFLTSVMLNSLKQKRQNETDMLASNSNNFRRQHLQEQIASQLFNNNASTLEETLEQTKQKQAHLDALMFYLLLSLSNQTTSSKPLISDEASSIATRMFHSSNSPSSLERQSNFLGNNMKRHVSEESFQRQSVPSDTNHTSYQQLLIGNYLDRMSNSIVSNFNENELSHSANEFKSSNYQTRQQVGRLSIGPENTLTRKEHGANLQQQAIKSADLRKLKDKQAIADSYLGAYHSFGRRKRETDSNDELESGYVYLEQPQEAATSVKFTKAIVEMFHTKKEPRRRVKREAQPRYDMDELVIQSIKIVDKLQFHEEELQRDKEQQQQRARLASKQSFPKSSLVRGGSQQQMLNNSASNAEAISEDEPAQANHFGLFSLNALSFLILAGSFIFVQMFLVVIYFVDSNRRRKLKEQFENERYHRQLANHLNYNSNTSSTISKYGESGRYSADTLNSNRTDFQPETLNYFHIMTPPTRSTGRRGDNYPASLSLISNKQSNLQVGPTMNWNLCNGVQRQQSSFSNEHHIDKRVTRCTVCSTPN